MTIELSVQTVTLILGIAGVLIAVLLNCRGLLRGIMNILKGLTSEFSQHWRVHVTTGCIILALNMIHPTIHGHWMVGGACGGMVADVFGVIAILVWIGGTIIEGCHNLPVAGAPVQRGGKR